MGRLNRKALMVLIAGMLVLIAMFCVACAAKDAGSTDYSKTNNQEAQVEEGDVVKVGEGGYIYKAQSDGLTVSKADSEGQIEVVRKESYLSFVPNELFVYGNYLVVMGSKIVPVYESGKAARYEKGSEIKIYDLESAKNPDAEQAEIRNIFFRGTYYTSRINGGCLYVAYRVTYLNETDATHFYIDSFYGEKEFYKNKNANRYIKGGFIITGVELENAQTADIKARYYNGEDVQDIYFSPYAIYAITDALYSTPSSCFSYGATYGMVTIVKISLENLSTVDKIENIKSDILNRYSLYDNGQYFFMVESLYGGGARISSYDSDLVKIDSLPEFGLGENLYAVRFVDDICYAVTFRQVDPLFKIDISTPYNMRMLGQLKIDDYSTQLQAFGTDRLIGVGFETDIRFSPKGIKVSLFNVEGGAPVEVNSLRFGDTSSSVAASDPRAILSEPDHNLFAIPANYAGTSGAIIFGIDEDGLLVERAFLADKQISGSIDNYAITQRIIRIGDYIYTISDAYITSYNIDTLEQAGTFDTRI